MAPFQDRPVTTLRIFLAITALTIAALAVPFFLPGGPGPAPGEADQGLPWQVEALPGGRSRVFGLVLGDATLEDARARLGKGMQVAIVVAPGEPASLEAFHDQVNAGFVLGRMVLGTKLPLPSIEAMLARAKKAEYMESTTRRVTLNDEDMAAALAATVSAIAFVPTVQLDEAMVLQRFGQPAQRLRSSPTTEHFLYPERGLDLVLDSAGKEVLQYVAPRDFERLRAPLVGKP